MAGNYTRTGTLAGRTPMVPATGTRFGSWEFVALASASRYHVRCVCGHERDVRSQDVRMGKSRSCGCLAGRTHTAGGEKRTLHGQDYGNKVYRAWRNAKNRVSNPRALKFKTYGAVGIDMDPSWFSSFPSFAAHVGEPPSPAHSLDRMDGTKGYWPGNVKWSTATEQARNRRVVRLLTYKGETKPLATWCEGLGVDPKKAYHRLRQGLSPHETLFGKEH